MITVKSESQTVIAFQGFEGSGTYNWGYAEPFQNPAIPQVIVGAGNYGAEYAKTGSNSMRFGGGSTTCGTGSGNCINGASGGGSCNNNRNGSEVVFESVDVSCYQNIQLSVAHRTHQLCTGQGQGLDSGDNLSFDISIDGGPFVSQGTVTGANNCGWNYTNVGCSGNVTNPFSFSVPEGTQTVALRVRLAYNRADEVIYIDDVKLTGNVAGASVTISPAGPIEVCEDETVILQASGTGTFQWNLYDEPIADANSSSYTPLTSGDYSASLGGGACIAVSNPISVTITELPEISINHNGPLTFCEGQGVILQTVASGVSVQWLRNDEPIEDAIQNSYQASTSGDYTVTVSSGTCSATSDLITVSVTEMPNAVVSPTGMISLCVGQTVTLETSSVGQLQWLQNDNSIESATQNEIEISTAGNYSLEVSNGACKDTSDVVVVNIVEALSPIVIPQGALDICGGQSVTLMVEDSFHTYQWYLGTEIITGENSSHYQASESGAYSVTVMNGECEGESNIVHVNLIEITIPQIVSSSSLSGCVGSEITFTVNGAYDSYQWLESDNLISGQIGSSYELTLTESTEISVQVTNETCSATSNVAVVTAIQLPIVSLTPNNDIVVCDESFTLIGTSSANNYQWLQSGIPISGATSNSHTVDEDGDYSFTSTSANGNCSSTSNEITVILGSAIEAEINSSALTACEGESISLSVTGNFDNIVWSNNQTTSSIDVVSSGLYSVIVTSGECTSEDEIQITIYPIPTVNAGIDTVSDCNTGVLLTGSGSGILSWLSNPTLTIYDGTGTALANPTTTTSYTLTSTLGSCVSTDMVTVEVDCNSIYIPNIFTPNGDGVNDFFEVKVRGAATFQLQIFNRWGEMLFESSDPSKVWNGGKQDYFAPDGVYYWTLNVKDRNGVPMLDKSRSHGTVTIVR